MQRIHSFVSASHGLKFMSVAKPIAMRQSFTLTLLFSLLLTASLFCSTAATAQNNYVPPPPNVYITPTVGPPTTTVFVSGNGFDPFAAVNIYFDTTDLAIVRTDINGAFGTTSPTPKPTISGVPIVAPKDALPGTHWITAVERDQNKSGQVQFLVRTDWAQFRFAPNHKGLNPYENILGPDTVVNLSPHWITPTEGSWLSSPSVANGIVYVAGGNGGIYALNASSGAIVWTKQVNLGFTSSPAVAGGMVFAGTGGYLVGDLYAFDASTGDLVWTKAIGPASSPAVVNGILYVRGLEYVFALNARTGQPLWGHEIEDYSYASPAVANGAVYFVEWGGALTALDANTGQTLWKCYIRAGDSSPAVANGVVYVGSSWDNNFYALNASTGTVLWEYATAGMVLSSPAVANGVVYVGSHDSRVYALNSSTGELIWKYATGGAFDSSPAVANGVVYVGSSDGNVYALNATTGAVLWMFLPEASPRPRWPTEFCISIQGEQSTRLISLADCHPTSSTRRRVPIRLR